MRQSLLRETLNGIVASASPQLRKQSIRAGPQDRRGGARCVHETDAIRAGLIGNCHAGWLFVALLWVHADLRRIGIGSRLMAEAERRGREFGCHSAFVDTFTFQGPEFYPKLGYREYARLDYPPDHDRIFFRKNLDINVVKGCSS